MHGGWYRDVVEPGKLPLMLAFIAFVVTFVIVRMITRMIRAGRGPFRNQVTAGGTHIHHDIPGLILLIVGAFLAVGTTRLLWDGVAAVFIGVGVALVLDEFALILHLKDTYWTDQGRLSVDLVFLTAACLGLALMGLSPFGVNNVGTAELDVRISVGTALIVNALLVIGCVLKGKYPLALIGVFVPVIAAIGAFRLARPKSVWFDRRYGERRRERATRRAADFDRRMIPALRRVQDAIGGTPTPDLPEHKPTGTS